eukprot:34423-Eustigmatos_ZCMA.PRE.1
MNQLLHNPVAAIKSFVGGLQDEFDVEDVTKDFKTSLQQDGDLNRKTTSVKNGHVEEYDSDVKGVS